MTEPGYDRRRRQYMPLAVTFAFGSTGRKLLGKFGRDGLLTWVCFLAACKTNWVQGRMTYTSEADGWTKLGLYGHEPDFTLNEFFTYTGHLKQTSRRRSGHVTDVVCTRWDDWNKDVTRQLDAERKAWKRQGNTRTSHGVNTDDARTLGGTEVYVEEEDRRDVRTKFICPQCSLETKSARRMKEHLYVVHDLTNVAHLEVAS